jgi:hypothetical protein
MKIIPSIPDARDERSAEMKVFRLLEQSKLDDSYVAYHSLRLAHHKRKPEGEIDFLVIGPGSVLVLEVKGGRVRRGEETGAWEFIDRYDRVTMKREGPFEQASSAMYSLRDWLFAQNLLDTKNIVFGYGVIFTDQLFKQVSVEWSPETILDRERIETTGIDTYIRGLEKYWREKTDQHATRDSAPTIKVIKQLVRPKFDIAVSLLTEIDEAERKLIALTEEQYRYLDILEEIPRILARGAAGTGKTVLAIEAAKRLARRGHKVLFICFSPILAQTIRVGVNESNITVSSFHDVMIRIVRQYSGSLAGYFPGINPLDSWFTEKLLPQFSLAVQNIPDVERFDAIIVDEAQDVMSFDYIMSFEYLLRGGFENGTWQMFYDPENQGAIYGKVEEAVVDYLGKSGSVIKLNRNCRNTKNIINQTRLMTGADFDVTGDGFGPEVRLQYYRTVESALEQLTGILDELINQQRIDPGTITLLSPKSLEESVCSQLPKNYRVRKLNGSLSDKFPSKDMTFATIPEFKGLENKIIILTDIDIDLASAAQRALLYVGMTRARAHLILSVAQHMKSEFEKFQASLGSK